MTGARRSLATAILLALAAGALAGQSSERVSRRLLVAVETRSEAWSATDALLASRSLLRAIQDSGAPVVLLDWGPEPFPSEADDSLVESRAPRADCWLLVALGGSPSKPTIDVRSRDMLAGKPAFEQRIDVTGPIDPSRIPADTWKDVVSLVVETYQPVDSSQPLESAWAERPPMWSQNTATLSITAVPGTTIAGLDGDPVTVGDGGTAVLRVRSPATYDLTASRVGYVPFGTRIYLDADRELKLSQIRAARFALDAGLYGLSFPSVDASVFLVPGWVFFRAGVMTYLGGLAFTDTSIFWSEPLSTAWAHLGTYALFPQQDVVRTYVAAGAFMRVAHPMGTPVTFDLLAPWGIQLILGLEASPWPASRFFLEWSPTEYVTQYPDLFRAVLGDSVPGSMVFTSFGVIDAGVLRLGWRWLW